MLDSIRCRALSLALLAPMLAMSAVTATAQTAVLDITDATVTEGDAVTTTVTFNIVCDP